MRAHTPAILGLSIFLASCGGSPPQTEPAAQAEPAKPADETRRFPKTGLIGSEVVNQHLLGKKFMPGGTLAHYRRGHAEYDMFIARLPTALDAAVILPDWKAVLTNAKVEPNFGGYSGDDSGRPVFVFAKDKWLAGIAGLPEKDADQAARILAARLY